MAAHRVAFDGLWRCLCPSIGSIEYLKTTRAISQVAGQPLRERWTSRPYSPLRVRQRSCRELHTTSRGPNEATNGANGYGTSNHDGSLGGGGGGDELVEAGIGFQPASDEIQTTATTTENAVTVQDLVKSRYPYPELYRADKITISSALSELQSQTKQVAFVKHLLSLPGATANASHYAVLLAAQASPAGGSAERVRALRRAMRDAGLPPDSAASHAALRALAVHPDYLERGSVLREMAAQWIELRPEGAWSVALGLLRDGQTELAVDRLEDMARDAAVPVPAWVFDVFVYRLAQLRHLDEAVAVLKLRVQQQQQMMEDKEAEKPEGGSAALNAWYFLLDECSRAHHYAGTRFVWDRMVHARALLNPSDGTLLNVLNTAARHHDAPLATAALERLSARGARLAPHHYEALVDCYAWAGDLPSALRALCIMHAAGLACTAGATRAIYAYLRRAPASAVDGAVALLLDLGGRRQHRPDGDDHGDVPIAAFDVVVEALCETGRIDAALDLYRRVRQVCRAGPAASTFRLLWRRCPSARIATFLAAEMAAFGIPADAFVYDRLVHVHAAGEGGDLDVAFRYLDEMARHAGDGVADAALAPAVAASALRDQTLLALIHRCVQERDDRAGQLVHEAEARGLELRV